MLTRQSQAQTFDSHSTGAEGPLTITGAQGTVDLAALGFHPAVQNVYNFTTINIASGATLRLSSKTLSGPVYFLAQGAVTIAGTIDASGENGHDYSNNAVDRVPAAGGAGGYSGGLGGNATIPPTDGNGPGHSPGTTTNAQIAGTPFGGTFTGNEYLNPLIGGSGGGGGSILTSCIFGAEGGAGGGAILIASSQPITISATGSIKANGGAGGIPCGGNTPAGSGGAIHLIAASISLPRVFPVLSANTGGTGATVGIVRLEAVTLTPSDASLFVAGRFIFSTPIALSIPVTPPPAIMVTSIAGVLVNANPFTVPSLINTSSPVAVDVQAQYIPVGTVPTIIVSSEIGPDQKIPCSSPLAGSLQLSTCSASITFPAGGSVGFVKAIWVPQ